MKTCLFCPKEIRVGNKEEHLIIKGISGGGFRSQKVTCSGCNEKAGNSLDLNIIQPFQQLITHLSPISKIGDKTMQCKTLTGEKIDLLPGGNPCNKIEITKDIFGKPIKTIERISPYYNNTNKVGGFLDTIQSKIEINLQIYNAKIEKGILRMILMLCDSYDPTLVRGEEFKDVKEFIYDFNKEQLWDMSFINIRPELITWIEKAFEINNFLKTDFSHRFLVHFDQVDKTCISVITLFDLISFHFKLSNNYNGSTKTILFHCPILKGEKPETKSIDLGKYKGILIPQLLWTKKREIYIQEEITLNYNKILRKAIKKVEPKNIKQFVNTCKELKMVDKDIFETYLKKLTYIFNWGDQKEKFEKWFEKIKYQYSIDIIQNLINSFNECCEKIGEPVEEITLDQK